LRMSSTESSVEVLVAMGFDRTRAEAALARTGGDVEFAANLLSRGGDFSAENDSEFDLIAASQPEPTIRAPTVFHPRVGGHEGVDHFADGVREGTLSEILDARISIFTEMGFTTVQAEEALRRCNNDVNEALTFLLQGGEEAH